MSKQGRDKKTERTPRAKSRQASRAVRSPAYQPVLIRWRFLVVSFFLICLAALLVWKVASVQVLPSQDRGFEFLQRYGKSQFIRKETINANRGVITDRNGEPLAVSSEMISICGNPKVLLESKDHWRSLAKVLGESEKSLADKINNYANKEFLYLKRYMPPGQANAILEMNLPGVFGQKEYQRFYPAGEVTAHILGMTNINEKGQEGLELSYNEWLQGFPGYKQVIKDLKGRTIEDVRLVKAAQPGKELQLSIDLRLQYLAYRELKEAVAKHNAVSGSLVVMDSYTGEVLAMVNQPSYNPNNRSSLSSAAMKNRAVTDQFEPGSTMKPFAVLAGLESKTISPNTKIDTSPGRIRLPGKTVFDPVNYGILDVTHVIAESSQVGITKIAMDIEPNFMRSMFHRAGLGESTGSGLPGESNGSLPNHQKWHPVERATLAYGYGLTVTTLQLAHAYTIFANDGLQRPVSLLKLSDKALNDIPANRIVDSRYANQVLKMLEAVLAKGGTGVRAQLASYTAGGKTGTARKADQGGYLEEAKFSVFAGVAPLDNPRIVIGIMINEPRRGYYGGGDVAAPIFSRVAEGALRVLQVPPDKLTPKMYTVAVNGKGPLS